MMKKIFYSLSEASKITGLEAYVLRYWEVEFPELKPQKNRAGNRLYTINDIKIIMEIKKMLREESLTIAQAKGELSQRIRVEEREQPELPL